MSDTLISWFQDGERRVAIYKRSPPDRFDWKWSHPYLIEKYSPGSAMVPSYFQTFEQATDAMLAHLNPSDDR